MVMVPLFAVCSASSPASFTVDLEDLPLAPNSFSNGSDLSGEFFSRGIRFGNDFSNDFGFDVWSGFAYSNVQDPTTPGFENQYASASGGGVGGLGAYAIGFDNTFAESQQDVITLPEPAPIAGFYVNNTTYAALSMRDGDAFSKSFGGVDGGDPDWFLLTVTGQDIGGGELGTVEFYLADYRFSNPEFDYIITDWAWVDTSSFGDHVSSLQFGLSSSDQNGSVMNTPAYFALDHLVVIPEPATGILIGMGALLCRIQRGRKKE